MRWQAKQAQDRLYQMLMAKKDKELLLYREEQARMREEKPFLFSSEPITGYRCFRWGAAMETENLFDLCAIAPEGENPFAWARKKRLMSAAYETTWPEYQPMHASCNVSNHKGVAGKDCHCGLWAVRTKEAALRYTGSYGSMIVAEVALWGHFVEHTQGWRAEYAYPQRIFVIQPYIKPRSSKGWQDADYAEFAARIGEQYGIPAEVWKQEPPPAPKKSPTIQRGTNYWGVTAASAANYTYTTISSVTPPPAPIWPASIVHPSELYSTIVLPKQLAIYTAELPF